MGYYIQTPYHKRKADWLKENLEATEVTGIEASKHVDDPKLAPVVVVDNGAFEAVGYAYSEREWAAFTDVNDPRPKRYLLMDRAKVEELTGFRD